MLIFAGSPSGSGGKSETCWTAVPLRLAAGDPGLVRMAVAVIAGLSGVHGLRASTTAQLVPQRHDRGDDQHQAGRDEKRAQPLLDVAQVHVGDADPQHRAADQQQDDRLSLPVHNRITPTIVPTRIASTKVAGANRVAKRRPNMPVCIANSLRSIIGPTTRNTSRAVSENSLSEAATNASASEQMDSTTARTASARTPSTALSPSVCSHLCGTATLIVAAAIAPITRYPTSWRAAAQKAAALLMPARSGRCGSLIHSSLPSRSQSQPIAQAVRILANARATTIRGWPGNATAVEASTIGLIAGEASRNARAAAGVTPRRTRAPAIGTEPHSQPGRTTPAALATGTASAGWLGRALAKNDGGT